MVQALVPLSSKPKPTYTFTTQKLKKKRDKDKNGPTITISKTLDKQTSLIASLHRSLCGKTFTVANEAKGELQHTLSIKFIRNEGYFCEIGDALAIWQDLGPSGTVLELLGQDAKRWGLFVYTSDPAQRFDSSSGRRVNLRKGEIGQLHFFNWGRGEEKGGVDELGKCMAEGKQLEVQETLRKEISKEKGKEVVQANPMVVREEEALFTGMAAVGLRKEGCVD